MAVAEKNTISYYNYFEQKFGYPHKLTDTICMYIYMYICTYHPVDQIISKSQIDYDNSKQHE